MSTIGNTNLTLADLAVDAKTKQVVELLNATNEVLQDIPWVQCNDGTTHKNVVRTGLPTATWRRLYGGVQPSKGTTAPVVDSCGMLEAVSKPDKALIDMAADPAKTRINQARAHLEGMAQTMASSIFYGDQSVNPERFTGLAPRFNSLSAGTSENVISGGSNDTDNTSIWLVCWDENTVHGLFPRGSQAGLSHEDLGEDVLTESDGAEYRIYRDWFKWDAGLAVPDWRYIVRICNIEVSDLVKDAATGADLIDLMVQAEETVPNLMNARWYCNRTIRSFLRRQINNANNVRVTQETVAGKIITKFDEIPVRRCDAILNTEALVS